MPNTFNPDEVVLEKIRFVEEYDPATKELLRIAKNIENPNINLTTSEREVVDAMGAPIATFYEAEKGTFTYDNSLLSIDLLASQFGSEKEIADSTHKIKIPMTEIIPIGSDGTVVLKHIPVGTQGAEIPYVKIMAEYGAFSDTYSISSTAGDKKFTLDTESKTITLPTGTTGSAVVSYEYESTEAVSVARISGVNPSVKELLIHGIFHPVCDRNVVYAGIIRIPRVVNDITSTDIKLTSDGKHSMKYKIEKAYCEDRAKLVEFIISKD